jgi:hypothetical protein
VLARRIRTDGFLDPCIPSRVPKPPSGPGWVHEINHDGYRLIVRRDGKAVRLFKGTPLAVTPSQWRPYIHRQKETMTLPPLACSTSC